MNTLWQDIRYGLRMLRKSSGFTAVVALTLALGIGANTALFSVVDAVLLKRLPVKEPGALVLFNWLSGKSWALGASGTKSRDPATGLHTSTSFSYAAFERFHADSLALSDKFAFAPLEQLNVRVDGQAEIAGGQLVSGGYYDGLGVRAMQGRTITDDDDNPAASPAAVISYRYWQRRFGGDPAAVSKTVHVNNTPFTIIGITPPAFSGALQVGESPDLSIPLAMEPQLRPGSASLREPWFWWLRIMGRLKPGVAMEQARASMESLFQQSALDGYTAGQARFPELKLDQPPRDAPRLRLTPGGQGLTEARRGYAQPLTILMAVMGFVLLIACANVANLLLARAAGRQKEMAVRLALGASRWRLIRQLLTESVLLALMGGALGALLALWGKEALVALQPWGGGDLVLDIALDARVLGFTAGVSLLTGLLFGLTPALHATRANPAPALKDTANRLDGRSRSMLGKGLIVGQVALSIVLLIGAGLFIRTLSNLHGVDAGFNQDRLLLFRVDPSLNQYPDAQIAQLYPRMIERIEAIPGVQSATLSRHPLLSGSRRSAGISVQGYTPPDEDAEIAVNLVGANFFETMEMPILLGRSLDLRDDRYASKVAVINQTMARKYFANGNPVGRRFGFGGPETSGEIEIVGVAKDAKYTDLRSATRPTVYIPYLQDIPTQANIAVRTADDPKALIASIRRAVRDVDPNLPLFSVKTQREQAEEMLSRERLFASLTNVFGLLALLLTCIGLYGAISYAVARRTREVGIRMALGAQQGDVLGLVMKESLRLVGIGVILGLGAAWMTTRLIESLLFGVTPTDPATMALAIVLMVTAAALAGYLPARRAAKVDPMVALRCE